MGEYTDTTSKLARDSEVTPPTIRKYADMGLLDHITISNGVRIFRTGQAEEVRRIYAKRLQDRGRRSALR